MTAVGGSLESVTLNGRTFAATADADVNVRLNGFSNESQANGNGSSRLIKTRMTAMVENIVVQADDDNDDHTFLQQLADTNDYFPVTVALASGAVYMGNLQIEGDLTRSTLNATASFNLSGPTLVEQ